jgi:hypothetical protein
MHILYIKLPLHWNSYAFLILCLCLHAISVIKHTIYQLLIHFKNK